MLNKVKNKKAFTIAETLVAILIMLMVSSILVTGIPAAKDAYEKVFVRSNAEVALSTAVYALRTEMAGARDVKVKGSSVQYLNGTYGSQSKIYMGSNKIMYQRYALVGDEDSTEGAQPLVSKSASDGMYIKYDGVSKGDGYITFKKLGVYKKAGDSKPKVSRDLSIPIF